jgi:hypothetical protein
MKKAAGGKRKRGGASSAAHLTSNKSSKTDIAATPSASSPVTSTIATQTDAPIEKRKLLMQLIRLLCKDSKFLSLCGRLKIIKDYQEQRYKFKSKDESLLLMLLVSNRSLFESLLNTEKAHTDFQNKIQWLVTPANTEAIELTFPFGETKCPISQGQISEEFGIVYVTADSSMGLISSELNFTQLINKFSGNPLCQDSCRLH